MTNDFEHNEHEHGEEFVEHEELGASDSKGAVGNLTEAWRTRPMLKFLVMIVGIVAVGIAAFSLMGGNTHTDLAHLTSLPQLKEAPGGSVSPYMRQQTEMANTERTDEAMASGGSAVPTPIGQTTDVSSLGTPDKKDDALNELRAETERLKQQVQQQQVQQIQQQQQITQRQPEQFDDSLAQAMQRQMNQLLESWTPKGIKQVTVMTLEDERKAAAADQAAAAAAASSSAANSAQAAPTKQKILVSAGTVSYAQLLTEANSDVPGPILAQIVSGPLSGARAVGAFKVSDGYEKYLVLEFTIADKKGKDYQISAIALDPDTTLGGMATEVDERYMVRVVLPAAAGFLQGMGQALGQGQSSIETTGTASVATTTGNGFKQGLYNGMGQAAQTAGQFFQDQANKTKPLVRVASGTPMGLFFTAPVYDLDISQTQPATQGPGYQQIGYPSPTQAAGAGPGAYPGTNVAGYGGLNSGANGAPYPNYGTPGFGYSNSAVNHYPNMIGAGGYTQNYGAGGYGQ